MSLPTRLIGLEIPPGNGHYASGQMPERVNALLIEHLASHPLQARLGVGV